MRAPLRHVHAGGRTFVWRATIRQVGDRRCVRVRAFGDRDGRALQADLLADRPPSWLREQP